MAYEPVVNGTPGELRPTDRHLNNMRLKIAVLCLAAASLLAQTASEWRQKGIEAYKNARYPEAVTAFQNAVNLQPNDATAHLYLANAWMAQWIPGAESPDNIRAADSAKAELRAVLRLDARNAAALESLGYLTFQEAGAAGNRDEKAIRLDEAKAWFEKLIEIEPRKKQAHYSLGVIAWSKWYPAFGEARARLGMKQEDPGPLRDPALRAELRARFSRVIDDGISHLQRALEIDPQYDDAMAYLNLLYRERADLSETPEEYQRDVATADEWLQKAMETRRSKAAAASTPSNEHHPPARIAYTGPPRFAYLVKKIDPECPAPAREARIRGIVKLNITIDRSGAVKNAQIISGHPLLITAAIDAVRQWVYRRTLLNGQPVEVMTIIDVPVCPAEQ